eukprot:TRINITY_DN10693_c0_g1_i8.p1 TRINITY_DN10693_c0_g1~~TRINITY_DN10693_c0_g1_i8.p1  ORF type:complete len:539 (-),score=116.43 TRINITY_DN10693_c0_g1_i8:680-2296(-)
MLSYTWGYTVGSIVAALVAYCEREQLLPSQTAVWICCLCINQHRVDERQEVSAAEFEREFEIRVAGIQHVLSLVAPWTRPENLQRVWCVFEIWRAIEHPGCRLEIIMPPAEQASFSEALVHGFDQIAKSLCAVDLERAEASQMADKRVIHELVSEGVGFEAVNKMVLAELREWLVATGEVALGSLPEGRRGDMLHGLGELLLEQGEHARAIALMEESAVTRESELGPNHPSTGVSLASLGAAKARLGDPHVALRLYKRALAILENQSDPHPATPSCMNNLARLHESQGNYEQALQLYEGAVGLWEAQQLGPDDPTLATGLQNLAQLLGLMGRYDRATAVHERALAICERALGADHALTGQVQASLGQLYQSAGAYDKGLVLFEQALSTLEKQLGGDHFQTAVCLSSLGGLHSAMGAHQTALPLCRQALAILTAKAGPEHLETATCLIVLGGVYEGLGEYEECLPIYQKSLAIREKELGPHHPMTAAGLCCLARLYQTMGQLDESFRIYERVLGIQEMTLGPEHVSTAGSLNNLAAVPF